MKSLLLFLGLLLFFPQLSSATELEQSSDYANRMASSMSSGILDTYTHTDHLGSTSAVTETTGTVVQSIGYHPYGEVKSNTGTHSSQRGYIGQYYDTDTSLNYLNARCC